MSPRVLFVDDEPFVLDGIRRMLRPKRGEWDMAFAPGGEAALEEMEKAACDVVVSDMRMPNMDGATLLQKVAERWPKTVRVVLSGQTDTRQQVRTARVAHQFLSKPTDASTLQRVIGWTYQLQNLLDDEALRATIGSVEALPSLPAVYSELERTIADPHTTLSKVATLIERDGSITAKLLQLSNSSFFGFRRQVTTVEQAIGLLGLEVTRALVLSHQVLSLTKGHRMAPGFSLEAHQNHALLVAGVARRLTTQRSQADEAYMAALLHDVGKVLLAMHEPDYFGEVLAAATAAGRPSYELERERRRVTHAEIGAYLLGLWGLPYSIVEAVAHHHGPSAVETDRIGIVAAVHLADALVHECTAARTGDGGAGTSRIDPGYLQSPAIAPAIPGCRAIAEEQVAQARGGG